MHGPRNEREGTGDPRPSLAERGVSQEVYLAHVRDAARDRVTARHMLEEDVNVVVERARRQWELFQRGLGAPE